MDLKSVIRTIPDYPKPGVMFRDVTTLLADARGFRRAVDELVQPLAGRKIDKVAGIETGYSVTYQRAGIEIHQARPPASSVNGRFGAGSRPFLR